MLHPVIGITVSIDPGQRIRPGADYLYVARSYARAVAEAGGQPVLLPPDLAPVRAATLCAGIVLSGGAMLPAALGAPDESADAEREERIAWDLALIDAARARHRPLLGVCYGMQLLNLRFGGTLHPDLGAGASLDHGGDGRVAPHPVTIREETALAALGGGAEVASSHRQAIARLALGLREVARAPDGVIEAFEGEGLLGVEWHPELDATGPVVYGWLVARAREGT